MIKPKNKWVQYSLLLLAYSIIYFIYTGSVPWHFADQLPGNLNGDMSQFLWNSHHFGEWVQGRQDFLYTDLLYTPIGTSLQYHTYSHLMAATSYLVGNSFLGINLIIWLHYIFSGLGAFLLARYFKLNWAWSFLAGFIFAFIPYKLTHYGGHYNLQQTAVIPFFVLVFFKSFPLRSDEPLFSKLKLFNILLLLALGILSILSSYIYSVFLLFFGIGYLLYFVLYRFIPNKWIRLDLFILLAVLVTELVPYLRGIGIQEHGAFWWADDMGKFITPNWNNKFYHWAMPSLYSYYNELSLKQSDCFLGFVFPIFFLLTSLILIVKKGKHTPYPVLGFLALFFFMLTSPKILIFQIEVGFLPTSIYHFVPFINNARIPERFILMLSLFLPILVFTIAQLLLEKKTVLNKVFPCILFVLLFIEFNQNHIDKAQQKDIPEWVGELKSLPQGNVLPLPTGVNDGNIATGDYENTHLYYQTIHHQKMIGGYISRISEDLRESHLADPVMRSILNLSKGEELKDSLTTEQVNLFLDKFQPRYILIPNSKESYQSFVKQHFASKIDREIKNATSSLYILKK